MNNWYREEELTFIRNSYTTMTNAQMGAALGRTGSSVGYQLYKLSLVRSGRKYYTAKEFSVVCKNAPQMSNRELAEKMGVSLNSLKAFIKNHSIRTGRTGYFPRGHRPANFRKKGWSAGGRSLLTRWKKGHLPFNTKEDGAITIRLDHPKDRKGRPYKWIRVSAGKWVHYHRWLWEQKHGPVPKKHMIIFKDGDTMNVDIDNLEMITMGENARRNYNPEKAQRAVKHLSDNYIAGRMANGDKVLRRAIIKGMPEIVELKRTQLKLKRQLNHERDHKAGAAAQ